MEQYVILPCINVVKSSSSVSAGDFERMRKGCCVVVYKYTKDCGA